MSKFLEIVILILLIFYLGNLSSHDNQNLRLIPEPDRMKWWREAKFGMFIHWGLYSIPAGIWKDQEVEGLGEWIMGRADIPVTEYEKLAAQFNPEKFNARQWVQIAKAAGMKYLVITSKHHDGFCLFKTRATKFNIIDATPYKKDVLKSLSEACRDEGIRFGVYYSILDWHHPSQEPNRNGDDVYGNNLMKSDQKKDYIDYMKIQLQELITQYNPDILWFDGGWTSWWTPDDGQMLMDYLWSLKPDLIINNRAAGTEEMEQIMGDFLTPEQFIPEEHKNRNWESNMTMNDSWGYKKNDQNWKPTKVLLFNLIDIVVKGGNFLLNVGPTAEGEIPNPSVQRLKEISAWMKVNGEAICGTHPWIVAREGPNKVDFINSYENGFETFKEPPYTSQDILFTAKGDTIYAISLAWPEKQVTVQSFSRLPIIAIKTVKMLGIDKTLEWDLTADGMVIQTPDKKPGNYAYVFKIVGEF
jgi:alpha-L-fucosidase